MKLETSAPEEFQGTVMGQINQRRGVIQNSNTNEGFCTVEADVPLSEMFGYATDLRSMSQGRATYSMEFAKYSEVPGNIAEQIVDKSKK